jgi:hypothetical protein
MEILLLMNQLEILHGFTCRRKSLCLHSCSSRALIIDLKFQYKPLPRAAEQRSAAGMRDFFPAHVPVRQQKSPEIQLGETFNHVARRNTWIAVSLPREEHTREIA